MAGLLHIRNARKDGSKDASQNGQNGEASSALLSWVWASTWVSFFGRDGETYTWLALGILPFDGALHEVWEEHKEWHW